MALSATWMVLHEHPVSASLAMYAQANDHYLRAEHPYLGDPTTFGRGHDLGARIGVKNPVRQWDLSLLGHEPHRRAAAYLCIRGERGSAGVVLSEAAGCGGKRDVPVLRVLLQALAIMQPLV